MIYGLLGKTLKHSFSPKIHSYFGNYRYELFGKEENEIEDLIRREDVVGFNITIPYKKTIMQYCDEIEESALKIGAVNTIIKKDGKVIGYNTDFQGFQYQLKRASIEVKNKKVIILGDGATSQTVEAVLNSLNAKEVLKFSRSGERPFKDLINHRDGEVIINCTPVGMYPNNLEEIINLYEYDHLEGVCDVIYNPHRTLLLLQAKDIGIKHSDGLPMLIAQAKSASEIFIGKKLKDEITEEVIHKLRKTTENIVLIGMPGSGKSSIGKIIAKELSREHIDTDTEIEKIAGKTIPEIFQSDGEEIFRKLEREVILEYGKSTGIVLSTGGGAVLNDDNYFLLKQNGRIYFLNRKVEELSTKGRPLSKGGITSLKAMESIRLPKYQKFCDLEIENKEISKSVEIILEDFNENIDS
ncbi:MAG: shikimate dehydrogenase [Tissierellia bacterium]|nr:shikimate dehydrogenase [Tissierellia bacterium]